MLARKKKNNKKECLFQKRDEDRSRLKPRLGDNAFKVEGLKRLFET